MPRKALRRTGTRPCLCKQCELRSGNVLGGLNTKGPGPGGVALRSVPAGTPARDFLLDDLGVSFLSPQFNKKRERCVLAFSTLCLHARCQCCAYDDPVGYLRVRTAEHSRGSSWCICLPASSNN